MVCVRVQVRVWSHHPVLHLAKKGHGHSLWFNTCCAPRKQRAPHCCKDASGTSAFLVQDPMPSQPTSTRPVTRGRTCSRRPQTTVEQRDLPPEPARGVFLEDSNTETIFSARKGTRETAQTSTDNHYVGSHV